MPPGRPSAPPGPSSTIGKHPLGDALYEWVRQREEPGAVTQDDMLDSGLIPKRDLALLVEAVNHLLARRLFRAVDIRGQAGLGYELIEEEDAANYTGLSTDEQLVYSMIDNAGTAGLWTKTIKAKSLMHVKVLERVYKQLEAKARIKVIKSVKHPGRKMYIKSNLTPSEEATGGTWFHDGRLDVGLIDAVSSFIEAQCSRASWRDADDDDEDDAILGSKRKRLDTDFDEDGEGKQKKVENGKIEVPKTKAQHHYVPIHPKYEGYPTLESLTASIQDAKFTPIAIPNNAIQQVLEIMVYDGRLHRVKRAPRSDETPDVPIEDRDKEDHGQIYMYRNFNNPLVLGTKRGRQKKIMTNSRTAMRSQEIEDIGRGGFGEIPCLDCPVFDICEDGGPVNARTCIYLPEWEKKMEDADEEAGDAWPHNETKRKVQPNG